MKKCDFFLGFDVFFRNSLLCSRISSRASFAVFAFLRLTVVCETKWDKTKWKWKSVVCEMGICSLRNGNLYFAKWKSVVCEMEICSLRNENL